MALEAKTLIVPDWIALTADVLYVNPASTKTYFQLLYFYNNNISSSVEVSVWLVPNDAGAVGAALGRYRRYLFSIGPRESIQFDLGKPGWVMEDENDSFQVSVDRSNSVNLLATGFIET